MEIFPNYCAYIPKWLTEKESQQAFAALEMELNWKSPQILMFGKWVNQPRLVDWQGDTFYTYRYSGQTMIAEPWHQAAETIRRRLEQTTGIRFNAVLINYYRSGQDSMGWHSDDEPELGQNPIIASVSLGAERDFLIKARLNPAEKFKIRLGNGSLLWMKAGFQENYMHALPKRALAAPRINLTFRYII